MIVAYLLAVATAVRCWWTWLAHGYTMEPDFALYTQGGLGLYPSPLGRLLGTAGPDVFAFLSAVGAGLVVYLVATLARRHGANPLLAALCASLMPATLYLGYAGIDPIGLALLLAAVVYSRKSLAVAAALTHLSLAPFALLLLPRSTWPARLALGTFGLVLAGCLLLTPYGPIVYGWAHPDALKAGALALAAFCALALPALLLGRWNRLVGWALLIGVGESILQHHLQARYVLPAAFLLAATASLNPAWRGAPTAAVTEERHTGRSGRTREGLVV